MNEPEQVRRANNFVTHVVRAFMPGVNVKPSGIQVLFQKRRPLKKSELRRLPQVRRLPPTTPVSRRPKRPTGRRLNAAERQAIELTDLMRAVEHVA
jgi:hypothetical protein